MLFDSIIELVSPILDRIIPDPKAKAAALLELQKLQQSGDLAAMVAQTDINKVEAASANLFVAGWRPAVGWVCVAALAFQFILFPILSWCGLKPPVLPTDMLYGLLASMLGVVGLRTYEKLQGVQNNH